MQIAAVWTGLSAESTTTTLTERLIDAASGHLAARGEQVEVTRVNVRDIARALGTMAVTAVPTPELEEAFAAVRRADAVITATPIYKAAPVGLHTLFWQLIDDASLAGTPVLMASTGGTPRHSLAVESALRPVLVYLKALVVPTTVFAATDDWGGADAGLASRIDAAAGELVEVATGTGSARRAARRRDVLDPDQVTPFADLLGR